MAGPRVVRRVHRVGPPVFRGQRDVGRQAGPEPRRRGGAHRHRWREPHGSHRGQRPWAAPLAPRRGRHALRRAHVRGDVRHGDPRATRRVPLHRLRGSLGRLPRRRQSPRCGGRVVSPHARRGRGHLLDEHAGQDGDVLSRSEVRALGSVHDRVPRGRGLSHARVLGDAKRAGLGRVARHERTRRPGTRHARERRATRARQHRRALHLLARALGRHGSALAVPVSFAPGGEGRTGQTQHQGRRQTRRQGKQGQGERLERQGSAGPGTTRERAARPGATRQRTARPGTNGSKARDNKATGSKARDNKATGSKARDNKATGSKARDNKATGSKARDNKATGSKARDNKATGSKARDNKATGSKAKVRAATTTATSRAHRRPASRRSKRCSPASTS